MAKYLMDKQSYPLPRGGRGRWMGEKGRILRRYAPQNDTEREAEASPTEQAAGRKDPPYSQAAAWMSS